MSTVSEAQSVLFVSAGNAGRSIMAESVLNKLGEGRYVAYSAGCHPTRKVNPLVLEVLRERGYPTDGLESKSWHAFSIPLPDPLQYVISVCAKTARVRPPAWPGSPLTLEWDFPDPTASDMPAADLRIALTRVCLDIERAVRNFLDEGA
ncbi:arsenate reductase ArsC [Pseudoduganella sp. GCM10020061]|uniref:arsenate reductase ArsC n=1 Tax=Pseudoduganella sp. GCM10020061 TaxID=3317345 RepID=UPI003634F6B9